jgi:hypothetical protein
MGFAQRMGLRPVRSIMQKDALDEETRNEVWNITYNLMQTLRNATSSYDAQTPTFDAVTSAIWAWEFKKPRDEQPGDSSVWSGVKNQVFKGEWVDVLDLIEAIVGYTDRFKDYNTEDAVEVFTGIYNSTFEIMLVGYRFIDMKLVPIDSDAEVEAITSALDQAQPFKGARHHLEQATRILADRKTTDYPNVIKESISAVESVCVAVTGEHTLGDALKRLEGSGAKIHPALKGAWLKMYGWTSDDDGIRHGGIDAPDADQSLAKYMLVTCSAFVSHIIEVGRKAGLI